MKQITDGERIIKTPRQLRNNVGHLTNADKLFCELIVLLHYGHSIAYRIAYNSQAKDSSNASMACRRLKDGAIVDYVTLLQRYYGSNMLSPYYWG